MHFTYTSSIFSAALVLQPAAAFWRLQCFGVVATGQIDPIMSPGEVSSHVHSVKGANTFSDNATYEDLLASTCSSCQVEQDHSAYWEPQLYFFASNGSVSAVTETPGHITYYKYTPCTTPNGQYTNPEPMPNGLRMISGDFLRRNFSLAVPDPPLPWSGNDATQDALAQKAIGFNCLNYNKAPEPSLYRHTLPDKAYLDANCADGIRVELLFPYCWNGALDSPDHKSHLAFPDANLNGGNCPAGYDRVINQLFFETIYPTQDYIGQDGFFAFSMGDPTGSGMHGDVVIAWEDGVLANATSMCGPLSGPDASGVITDCPVFTVTDQAAQSQCQIPAANYPLKEDVMSGLTKLPGNNPLQYGPQQATIAAGSQQPANNTAPPAEPSAQSTAPYVSGTTSVFTDSMGNIYLEKSMASTLSGPSPTTTATLTAPAANSAGPAGGAPVTTVSSVHDGALVELVVMQDVVTVTENGPAPTAAKREEHLHRHAARAKRHAHHGRMLQS